MNPNLPHGDEYHDHHTVNVSAYTFNSAEKKLGYMLRLNVDCVIQVKDVWHITLLPGYCRALTCSIFTSFQFSYHASIIHVFKAPGAGKYQEVGDYTTWRMKNANICICMCYDFGLFQNCTSKKWGERSTWCAISQAPRLPLRTFVSQRV